MRTLIRSLVLAALLLPVILLSACAELPDVAQSQHSQPVGEIYGSRTVGQTFLAHHGGLNGVDVLLSTDDCVSTEPVVFHLRQSVESTVDLRTVTISAADVTNGQYYRFGFDPIRNSQRQRYYFFLDSPTSSPGNVIAVKLGSGESYQDGSAYVDGQPAEGQLVFKLHYAPGWAGVGVLKTLLSIGLDLLPAALMLLLPGLVLNLFLLPPKIFDWRVKLALAPAFGLALYPVMLAWCLLVGLRPGAVLVWGIAGLSTAMLLVRFRHLPPRRLLRWTQSAWRAWWRSDARYSDLTTLAVVGLMVGALFLPIQRFDAPLWDDSVQHAVIAQRIFEHGGLFDSWEPYTPYRGMTIHFGFHTAVAAYMWLTGAEVAPATLLMGQVVNLVGALALYGLILYLSRRNGHRGNEWAGIGTLMVVGLFAIVPAAYTNWGRYPQLTGQAILPAAACLLWAVGEAQRKSGKLILLAGLTAAGMALSYYRTPFLYALFVLTWMVIWAIPSWVGRKRVWWRDWVGLGLVAVALLVLMAPWIGLGLLKFGQAAPAGAAASSSVSAPRPDLWEMYRPWWLQPGYRSLLLGALAGALVAFALRRWRIVVLAGWLAGFILFPLLPPFTYDNSTLFATMIAIYLPTSLLIGWLAGTVTQALLHHLPRRVRLTLILAILGIAGYGAARGLTGINPAFVLVTRPDMEAMEWVRQHTPADAQFLINGLVYTDGYSVVGGDAGWWLPLLARRANSIPPQYALFTAAPIEPRYTQQVNDLVHTLLAHPPTTAEGTQALCDFGITHVYIGQQRGMVVAALPIQPDKPMLDVAELTGSDLFELLYQQDRVRIYQFDRSACGP